MAVDALACRGAPKPILWPASRGTAGTGQTEENRLTPCAGSIPAAAGFLLCRARCPVVDHGSNFQGAPGSDVVPTLRPRSGPLKAAENLLCPNRSNPSYLNKSLVN